MVCGERSATSGTTCLPGEGDLGTRGTRWLLRWNVESDFDQLAGLTAPPSPRTRDPDAEARAAHQRHADEHRQDDRSAERGRFRVPGPPEDPSAQRGCTEDEQSHRLGLCPIRASGPVAPTIIGFLLRGSRQALERGTLFADRAQPGDARPKAPAFECLVRRCGDHPRRWLHSSPERSKQA
jgi:hypothetical protein